MAFKALMARNHCWRSS